MVLTRAQTGKTTLNPKKVHL